MKKKKIIVSIAAVSISLLIGGGIYVGVYKSNESNKLQEVNQSINTMNVEKGNIRTVVEAGGRVFLSDESNPNSIIIKLAVNQYDISNLQVNQTVEITSKVFPDDIVMGRITEIANTASEGSSPTYVIKVAIAKTILESGEITYPAVNVRKGASIEYSIITQLEKGTKVKILEKKNNWVKIRMEDNSEGWIVLDSVNSLGLEEGNIESKVYRDDVIIRESNSLNSKSLGKLVQGEKVIIIDKKDDWYKVKVDDETTGWIQESDLVLQKLIDGMSVTGTIIVSEKKDILKVPIEAIQKDENGYYVTMANTNEKRYVQVGENDSEYIEVTEGLSENDMVITQ